MMNSIIFSQPMTLIYVFLGGGLGASLRFLISSTLMSFSFRFWSGTLVVNLLGCLSFYCLEKYLGGSLSREWQLFYKVGVLGSLTTFSTFSFEVVSLIKSGRLYEALGVGALNVVFGIMIGVWILR